MLTLFTNPSVARCGNGNDVKRRLLPVIASASLLLGGCAMGGLLPERQASSGQASAGTITTARGVESSLPTTGARESNLAFAQLPSSRPDVKVKPQSAELFAQSLAALRSSDYVQAESLLGKITKFQPELSGPWLNLGQVYLAGDRTDSAREAFEQAIEANPTNCAAYNQLGVLARQEGRLLEAEDSYLACIDRDPTFPQVYLNLGILYEVYLGKLPQALKAYREYQDLAGVSGVEDTRVKGWVVDLERRL